MTAAQVSYKQTNKQFKKTSTSTACCLHKYTKHCTHEHTGVYWLALQIPHSTWSVFLGVLIPRRSWLIWNWTAWIFTIVGCHGVTPHLSLIEVLSPLLQWFHTTPRSEYNKTWLRPDVYKLSTDMSGRANVNITLMPERAPMSSLRPLPLPGLDCGCL